MENNWKMVMAETVGRVVNIIEIFISFMIHSGKNKWQMNQPMSNSVINTSEFSVRKYKPELEISLHLKFSFLMYVKEGLEGKAKEKTK